MTVSAAEQSRRASFGRGMAEGLRMAGINNPEQVMQAAKLQRKEEGLTSIARKVLDAVPIQEVWNKDQIGAEVRRRGTCTDRKVIDGCLGGLVDSGLVKERPVGHFTRAVARAPAVTTEKTIQMPKKEIAMPATNVRPIAAAQTESATPSDMLTRLANLGALLRRAADEVDAVALEVEDRVKSAGEDGEKLRQLQSTLRGLMG